MPVAKGVKRILFVGDDGDDGDDGNVLCSVVGSGGSLEVVDGEKYKK